MLKAFSDAVTQKKNQSSQGTQQGHLFPQKKKPSTNIADTRSQTFTVSAGRKESKQTVRSNRKLLGIYYLKHETNNWAQSTLSFPVGLQEPLSCQATETRVIREHHTARQTLETHSPRHLGGRRTTWSAETTVDGQRQRVGIPAHARTARDSLRQKRLTEVLC